MAVSFFISLIASVQAVHLVPLSLSLFSLSLHSKTVECFRPSRNYEHTEGEEHASGKFASTKIAMWANINDADVYMLYELAAAEIWPYQEFRPNVQGLFTSDYSFDTLLAKEMKMFGLLSAKVQINAKRSDVYVVIASSQGAAGLGVDLQSATLLSLQDLMTILRDEVAPNDQALLDRAMSVKWNGKGFEDYTFWVLRRADFEGIDRGVQEGPTAADRSVVLAEPEDETRLRAQGFGRFIDEHRVTNLEVGPKSFKYKIGLIGGNGPIAGAFLLLMLRDSLNKRGGTGEGIAIEMYSFAQHPMSGIEAALNPIMTAKYLGGLTNFLRRKDIDIFGCASNTWFQNIYLPKSVAWGSATIDIGLAIKSGFRLVHLPRVTIKRALCLHKKRLGMIATHWTQMTGRSEGIVDDLGFLKEGTGVQEGQGKSLKNVYALEVARLAVDGDTKILSANVDTSWDAIMVAKHGDIPNAKRMLLDDTTFSSDDYAKLHLTVPDHFGKSNQHQWAAGRIKGNVRYLVEQKVDAIIGGCTEVGLALTQDDINPIAEGIDFIDSGAVLADMLAERAASGGQISQANCDG